MNNLSRRRFLIQIGGVTAGLPLLSLLESCGSDTKKSASTTVSTSTAASSATTTATTTPASGSTASSVASIGKATYQLSWLKDSQWAGEYAADSKGYWTALGLEVEMLAGGGDLDPTAVIVAGKALTGPPAAAPIAGAIAAGADMKIVATKFQKSPFAIVSRAEKPIATIADMKGKNIGVSEFNTVTFSTFLSVNGLSDSDVNVVPYNFDPSPLISGEIDGLLGYINDEPTSLAAGGVETTALLLADFGYDVIANAYTVEGKTLTDPESRARLVALLAGIVQGWKDVIADTDTVVPPLLTKYTSELSIDPAVGLAVVKASTALIVGDGAVGDIFKLSPAKVDQTISLLAKEQTALDASAFDFTVMDDVYKLVT